MHLRHLVAPQTRNNHARTAEPPQRISFSPIFILSWQGNMRLAPAEEAVRVAAASSTTVKIEGVTVKVEEEVALLPHCTRLAALFTELVVRLGGMLTKTIGSEK